ncbi:succinate dehydrogenase/fumarate reductase iron-sulfur subunit [Cocleimonas sp. KMM 6892]|uniref:succinate dehydrogenase/fumarate reductase iron-sulfur subunit n=1 Tax=unclassified Cocleimonas TaxID=2639732 RepID=UPI002DBCA0CF|nr:MULTISPECIES: succinate dehydrogenase/fumarate reductase iron-sulfur subunit [unclassified Cocleimonas]MEB8432694.1 succinate dehydrogenase/fumarate reductase iron-sulfur subunit [Cocleimonas sp. KMM 6892]MEC4715553.1 succinate dehydrogenase/fumarate reductase iron-sulfur subunit [Cocleimonas sp. KMM 6895]MEC4744829.1 succinate dehydrogenase/fumarate reductase iron-sulfur subunit [Cocleimonas sp. KMM 6896]
MANKGKTIKVLLSRGDNSNSALKEYEVPAKESQTVLDVVTWIQRNLEPDLSYRFACRVGMCGSCAMTVNGKPRWTCRTHVSKVMDGDTITIEPLRNMPIIKDLACDLNEFFEKWTKAKGHFVPTKTRDDSVQIISPKEKSRREANAGIECINCGVCYASCDVVENDASYLGPAALNRAWTLVNDVRDGGRIDRLKAVTGDGGCQSCHSQQGCTTYCPNTLNPTRSIAGLKKAAAIATLKGEM